MKALASGDVLEDNGYYKTIVNKRVDTIIVSDAVCYKYMVYNECPTGRDHQLAYQVFINGELVYYKLTHKFMTKTQFKELLMEELSKCLKQEMGLSQKKADLHSL